MEQNSNNIVSYPTFCRVRVNRGSIISTTANVVWGYIRGEEQKLTSSYCLRLSTYWSARKYSRSAINRKSFCFPFVFRLLNRTFAERLLQQQSKRYENMAERRIIRNSTAEFLIFQIEGKEQGVEVMYADKTIWCTQKTMAALFDVGVPAISKHLANVFETGELNENATISKMETVQQEGNREVKRTVVMYKLDAIIAVGFRVNSVRATQFRQWATSVLREYAIRGYVLDRKRMENGTFLGEDYFEHLLAEIREIRLSERRFYQKLTDIYATAVDYNRDAPTTRLFFQMMQNKMHYAVHRHTAAELIMERADAEQEHMGLTTWENAPDGKIVKTDVVIAKNYLKEVELADMGQLVNGVLELAERMAKRHIPMTMEDWAKQIDTILAAGRNEVLQNTGTVTAEEAKEHAETEFEKYRIVQDRLFQSDFDKYLGTLPFEEENVDKQE